MSPTGSRAWSGSWCVPKEAFGDGALAPGWNHLPAPAACAAFGDAWMRAAHTLALRVPSAVVPEEANTLLNPAHDAAARLRVVAERAFGFDTRLMG